MTEERLFEILVHIPVAERAAVLDRVCGADAALRGRLEALLAADAPREASASASAGQAATADPDGTRSRPADTDAGAGQVIGGRYKLLQRIGEGGMGEVWMAEQTAPVKRRVAVKLIRAERGTSKTILARFEAERQAIALMDHPHIARLLDAGTAADGRPYFAMELVKGVPLTDYCDRHRLPVPDRLALFTQICTAVQHAHQKGVIHRDLKPSNVLVESHGGKPVPKVIDFGLAKAAGGVTLTERTLFTGFGSVMGTPLYMAPEQATFDAVDVDTRADIYALGVILYELLTGTTPLTREAVKKAALDQVLKLVREQDAPTPSSRLSTSQAAPSVAAARQTEPAKLGRFVKGELDWIVLKALAKDRDRRYDTANGLAKDIERFLNQEPVQAGPPTAGYRLRKFVQRNRGPVLAAGVVLLAVLLGFTGTGWGLVRAVDAEGKARKDRDDAVQAKEAETAALGKMREAKTDAEEQKKEADKQRDAALDQSAINLTRLAVSQLNDPGGRAGTALALLRDVPADRRGWEWPVIARRTEGGYAAYRGHAVGVLAVTPTLRGRDEFASGDRDGVVKVWDAVTGETVRTIRAHAGPVSLVTPLPGRKDELLTAGHDGEIVVWDLAAGKELRRWAAPGGWVHDGALTDDGKRLVTASGGPMPDADPDRPGYRATPAVVAVWDVADGKPVARMEGEFDSASAVGLFPDGERVTMVNPAGVRVWELATGKLLHAWEVKEGLTELVAVSPDRQTVAVCTRLGRLSLRATDTGKEVVGAEKVYGRVAAYLPDGRLLVGGRTRVTAFHPATLEKLGEWQGHADWVRAINLGPLSYLVVTGAEDAVVRLWSTLGPDQGPVLHHCLPVNSAAFRHDGKRLFVGVGGFLNECGGVCWDLEEGKVLWRRVARSPTGLTPRPGGHQALGTDLGPAVVAAAWAGDDLIGLLADGRVQRIDPTTGKGDAGVQALTYDKSPFQWPKLAATADGTLAAACVSSCNVAVVDLKGRKVLRTLPDTDMNTTMVFSPDGKTLFTEDRVGVRLWDLGADSPPRKVSDRAVSIALSPDSGRVYTADGDGTLTAFDTASGSKIWRMAGRLSRPLHLRVSGDGRRLVVQSDGVGVVYDAKTGAELVTFPPARLNGEDAAAFSPDGRWLALAGGNGTIRLIDGRPGDTLPRPLPSGRNDVLAVGQTSYATPVGSELKAEGNRVEVWAFDGTQPPWASEQAAVVFAFSPDGSRLAGGTNTGSVIVWDADTGKAVQTVQGPKRPVRRVAFSPDRSRVAAITVGDNEFPRLPRELAALAGGAVQAENRSRSLIPPKFTLHCWEVSSGRSEPAEAEVTGLDGRRFDGITWDNNTPKPDRFRPAADRRNEVMDLTGGFNFPFTRVRRSLVTTDGRKLVTTEGTVTDLGTTGTDERHFRRLMHTPMVAVRPEELAGESEPNK